MKFTIKASELQSILEKAVPIIPQRTPLAVLENIELKADNGILSVRTTDQEIKYTGEIKISSDGKASALIGANFATLIGLTPSDSDVNMDFGAKGLSVKTSQSKYNFTTPVGELPDIGHDFKKTGSFKIKSELLKKLISSTIFACSSDASLKKFDSVFNGLDFKGEKGLLKVTGTAGVLLCNASVKIDTDISLILPVKTCSIISSCFDGDVKVEFNKNLIRLSDKKISIDSRLIDMQYLPYEERVFAKLEGAKELLCNRKEFLNALKRISIFAIGASNEVSFNISNNSILMDIRNAEEATTGTESIKCDYAGKDLRITMNSKFVLQAVASIESENIKLRFINSKTPCMFEPEKNSEVTFKSFIGTIDA